LISAAADGLRKCTVADALAIAEATLGDADVWARSLVAYRLTSEFQQDWKLEVGCWLRLADELGFLEQLRNRIRRAVNEAQAPAVTGANDSAHRILLSELAPAMAAYYFVRQGWGFIEWEPRTASADVDVRLRCPCGIVTDLQVKAPDQPGERQRGRIHEGEHDEWVCGAIRHAMQQLVASPGPQRIIVVSPQRTFPISAAALTSFLCGRTIGTELGVTLCSADRGAFASAAGRKTGAVIDLSLLRTEAEVFYRCTALLNPWAESNAAPDASVFANARVLHLENGTFSWHPEQPGRSFALPTGTRYIE
jgi:hypothetical protein